MARKIQWSSQQQEIFGWFGNGGFSRNLIVRARAGTGKTTTILEAASYAPERNILFCAFNARIAKELNDRLPRSGNATAKTLHGVGFGAVIRNWGKKNVDTKRALWLADEIAERQSVTPPADVIKTVAAIHTKGRELAPHAKRVGDLTDIIYRFDLQAESETSTWNTDTLESMALECMELAAQGPTRNSIDFADMLFLPVRNGWLRKSFDLVIVDEAQDMNSTQLEIAQGVCKGRIAVVGDDKQAIYGFRGADSESLDRLKSELGAQELGLTTTYRCATKIVRLAQDFVPDFEAGPDNPEGVIDSIHVDKLSESVSLGDFVLSRTNAPLVSLCLSFLREGKRAKIAGKNFGGSLTALIRKLATGRAKNSVPALLSKISAWTDKQVERALAADDQGSAELAQDKAETLNAIASGADSVSEVISRIEKLFTDNGLGAAGTITLSSVHKSKGLEADRVFILESTMQDSNQEECNIQYVAITRAKKHLTWVVE